MLYAIYSFNVSGEDRAINVNYNNPLYFILLVFTSFFETRRLN